jgi:hypothetical protein
MKGLFGLKILQKIKELGAHAKILLSNLRTPEVAARHFIDYIKTGIVELEEACLLLERVIHPTLSDTVYDRRTRALSGTHPRTHHRAPHRPR